MSEDIVGDSRTLSAQLLRQADVVAETAGAYTEANTMAEAADYLDQLADLLQASRRPDRPFDSNTLRLPGRLRAYAGEGNPSSSLHLRAAEAIEKAVSEMMAIASTRARKLDLTPAQTAMLFADDRSPFKNEGATREALVRKGVLTENGRDPTPLAIEHVWRACEQALDRLLETPEDRRGSRIVQCDAQLLQLLKAPTKTLIDIYVYRGHRPMVVEDGDGQNPIAYLHPYYLWQIRTRRAGLFLERTSIIGWKGSYGYRLRERLPA